MKLGCKILITLLLTLVIENHLMYAQEKITSSPLLNIDQIKPSFDEQGENKENLTIDKSLKEKKLKKPKLIPCHFDWPRQNYRKILGNNYLFE